MTTATRARVPKAGSGPRAASPLGDSISEDISEATAGSAEYRRARAKYAVAEETARTLIAFRAERRLTQKAAANVLGMTESMVSRLERGDHVPNVATLLRVAEATGTSLHVRFERAS